MALSADEKIKMRQTARAQAKQSFDYFGYSKELKAFFEDKTTTKEIK